MNRRMSSSTRGGSVKLTTSTFEVGDEGWGSLNISLKMGDAKERKILWTRKSRLSVPWVLRSMTSPSGQLNISSEVIVTMRRRELWKRQGTRPAIKV